MRCPAPFASLPLLLWPKRPAAPRVFQCWRALRSGTGRRPSAAPAAQMAESEPSRPRRFTFSEGPEAPGASPSASAPSTVPVPRVVPPSLSPSTSSGAVPRLGGFSSTPPTPVRPQHVPPVHHSQWSSQQQPQQQSSWGGWGGDWGWEDSPCAAAAAMWAAWGKGGGGFGGPPSCDGGVNMMIGTVKSYSAVKGFGFMIHPDISQEPCGTSDLAGTTMSFEIFRAPDGKPQARNLRPAPAGVGMPPPPVNPNQHMPAGFPTPVPGLVRPGFPHPLLRPGFPNPLLRPAVPGMAVPSQPKRRAWSPHAGSRAIATASMDEEDPMAHGGRRRRVAHVEGNYATLVFLPVRPTRPWRATAVAARELLLRLGAREAELVAEEMWRAVGCEWFIRPFEDRLRKLVDGLQVPENFQERVWFNETFDVFSSPEADRYFAGALWRGGEPVTWWGGEGRTIGNRTNSFRSSAQAVEKKIRD
eukprot:g3247.t1